MSAKEVFSNLRPIFFRSLSPRGRQRGPPPDSLRDGVPFPCYEALAPIPPSASSLGKAAGRPCFFPAAPPFPLLSRARSRPLESACICHGEHGQPAGGDDRRLFSSFGVSFGNFGLSGLHPSPYYRSRFWSQQVGARWRFFSLPSLPIPSDFSPFCFFFCLVSSTGRGRVFDAGDAPTGFRLRTFLVLPSFRLTIDSSSRTGVCGSPPLFSGPPRSLRRHAFPLSAGGRRFGLGGVVSRFSFRETSLFSVRSFSFLRRRRARPFLLAFSRRTRSSFSSAA